MLFEPTEDKVYPSLLAGISLRSSEFEWPTLNPDTKESLGSLITTICLAEGKILRYFDEL